MKCPHCNVEFHPTWDFQFFTRGQAVIPYAGGPTAVNVRDRWHWAYRTTYCAGPDCQKLIVQVGPNSMSGISNPPWRFVVPSYSGRPAAPKEVPAHIAQDHFEACKVLPHSPKASAALARRCLQNMLRDHGYKAKDLAKEVDLLLNESDPKKALPSKIRDTIDAVRNFGNFSAHPITDLTSLQVIDVEPHEAEWCLEIVEDLFEHFYVGPAIAAARKSALNAKLAAAGKPAAK